MQNISTALTFSIIGAVVFGYIYWRDATREGFSSDKILDSFFLMLIGGFLGGKLLFRSLGYDYFRYQFFTSPMILEGVLVGGALLTYLTNKKNNWSHWKIGDMLAPAITLFQAILFFGFWIANKQAFSLYTALAFSVLYIFIRFLKNRRYIGSSARFFLLKRINRSIFTGGLFAIYLTGSSAIAMLFLVIHQNLESGFWWFQIAFYFSIFVASYILFEDVRKSQSLNMNPSKKLTSKFISHVSLILKKRRRQIEESEKTINKNDPFMIEAQEGFRNADEYGDEILEKTEHTNLQAVNNELKKEDKSIIATLKRIKIGKYGVCKSCGKRIAYKRLLVFPTAKLCVSCQEKLDK